MQKNLDKRDLFGVGTGYIDHYIACLSLWKIMHLKKIKVGLVRLLNNANTEGGTE